MSGKLRWFLLAVLVLAADLLSKHFVYEPLVQGRHEWLLGEWFGLTKVQNSGMMWGLFPDFPQALVWGRVVASLAVVWMILTTPRQSRMLLFSLALVLGGALGNIYDGFALGHVRDFLMVDLDLPAFDPFPIFNVADSGISVGVVLLALGMLLEGRNAAAQKRAEEASDEQGANGKPRGI
ncbi:MAG: lipoprotein signal peptidase [Planctomycetota bacterium]|nr:MAG: lipoprotein signal peptidase [Planctomycetota bacterium]